MLCEISQLKQTLNTRCSIAFSLSIEVEWLLPDNYYCDGEYDDDGQLSPDSLMHVIEITNLIARR